MKPRTAKCPLCGEHFELEYGLEERDYTNCPECYSELQVIRLNPPVLEGVTDEYSEDYLGADDEGEEFQ